jgi:hypothetical protein
MNKSIRNKKSSRTILWFVVGFAAIVLGIMGQLVVRRTERDSSLELAATQVELARIENILENYEFSKEEKVGLANQLRNDERAFERELRSFKRPSMKSALLGKLNLPKKNCVVSSSITLGHSLKKLLIYSSDPGQQLVIPVWRQEEEFDEVRPEPKYEVVIDVPPGELNELEFGLVEDYRSEPYFIVRFAKQEKLKVELPEFNSKSSSSSGGQPSGLLLPNVVSNNFVSFRFDRPDLVLCLLRQGIWLRQHFVQITLADKKADVTTNLAFCLYWKSSDPLYASDLGVARLPVDANDPDQVQLDPETGLYRITPPDKTQSDSEKE